MKYLDLKANILAAIKILEDYYEFRTYKNRPLSGWSCPFCKIFGPSISTGTMDCSHKIPCIWWIMKGKGCWGEHASTVRNFNERRLNRIAELHEWRATVENWTRADIGRLFFRTKYGNTLRNFEAERKAEDGDQKTA